MGKTVKAPASQPAAPVTKAPKVVGGRPDDRNPPKPPTTTAKPKK